MDRNDHRMWYCSIRCPLDEAQLYRKVYRAIPLFHTPPLVKPSFHTQRSDDAKATSAERQQKEMRGRQLIHSDLVRGLRALVRHDPKIRDLKSLHGLPTIQTHSRYVETLVQSILSQQISGSAAQTIIGRVKDAAGTLNDIHLIAELPDEILRGCGVSSQKLSYLRSLTEHILNNQLKLKGLSRLSDEEIIHELTAVKGIGVWTAKMFLIFSLGRLNVLAFEDLGVQHGIRTVYNLGHMPDKSEVERVAQENRWEPYCSMACWYMWRASGD